MTESAPPARTPLFLIVATSAALLGALGLLVSLVVSENKPLPPIPPPIHHAIALPDDDAPTTTTHRPPPANPTKIPAPAARTAGRPPEEQGLSVEALDILDRTNWDALGSMMLRYTTGPELPLGTSLPALAGQVLAEGHTRLDAFARAEGLPDARAASFHPSVRARLALAWLSASTTPPTKEQEEGVRRLVREHYGPDWKAAWSTAPSLEKAVLEMKAQENYENGLKTLLPEREHGIYLEALGNDPLRNERVPCETLRSEPEHRAEALANYWDRLFDHAVPRGTLLERAADLVGKAGQATGDLDVERARRRRLLGLQIEAEKALAPAGVAASARAIRFLPPEPGK